MVITDELLLEACVRAASPKVYTYLNPYNRFFTFVYISLYRQSNLLPLKVGISVFSKNEFFSHFHVYAYHGDRLCDADPISKFNADCVSYLRSA